MGDKRKVGRPQIEHRMHSGFHVSGTDRQTLKLHLQQGLRILPTITLN